jgi:DNA-binding NtrC family response regulator
MSTSDESAKAILSAEDEQVVRFSSSSFFPTTVMIVDDEEVVRRFCSIALERDGHSIIVAGSGEEALAMLRDFVGTVHLVLSDLRMKVGMNGLTFRERVLEERPGTLFAIMSGDTFNGVPDGIEKVQKPFTNAQLCEHVQRLLKRD